MIEPELFPQDTAPAPPVDPGQAVDPAATAAPAPAPPPVLPLANDLHGRATPHSDPRLGPGRSGLSTDLLSESPPSRRSPRGSVSHPSPTVRGMESSGAAAATVAGGNGSGVGDLGGRREGSVSSCGSSPGSVSHPSPTIRGMEISGAAAVTAGRNGSGAGDLAGRVLGSLDVLVGALRDLRGARVEERLRLVGRCESRLAAVKSEAVAELAAWRGEAHAAGVLRHDLKQSRGAAKGEVKLAGQLAGVPATAEALAGGEITPRHARLIAEAAEAAPPGAPIDEEALLEAAGEQPADLFGRTVRGHLDERAGEGLAELRERQRARRRVSWKQDPDGMYQLFGTFDPVSGARIETALTAVATKLWHAEDPKNRVSAKQRLADALELLVTNSGPGNPANANGTGQSAARGDAHAGTRNGNGGAHRHGHGIAQGVDLLVIADYDTVAGELANPRLGDGTPLSAEELRALACDANILPAIFDSKGQPLWLGRARRRVSAGQRIALIARDGGCIGCGANPNWCQAHHIRHWAHGGTTDIDNLCLLCSHCHHHEVHTHGADITRRPNGKYTLQRPNQRPPPTPPLTPSPEPVSRPGLCRRPGSGLRGLPVRTWTAVRTLPGHPRRNGPVCAGRQDGPCTANERRIWTDTEAAGRRPATMLILGIESASDQCGCALANEAGVIAETRLALPRRHAEALAPQMRFVCEQAGVALADIEVVAVDHGPGLYTGLRAGLATAKAAAAALAIGVVPVGSLEALAYGAAAVARPGETVLSVLDARRGEVFWAWYRIAAPAPDSPPPDSPPPDLPPPDPPAPDRPPPDLLAPDRPPPDLPPPDLPAPDRPPPDLPASDLPVRDPLAPGSLAPGSLTPDLRVPDPPAAAPGSATDLAGGPAGGEGDPSSAGDMKPVQMRLVQLSAPQVGPPADLLAGLASGDRPTGRTVVVGDGALRHADLLAVAHVVLAGPELRFPSPASVALLGRRRALTGGTVTPEQVEALYLRSPDAQPQPGSGPPDS